MHGRKLLLLLAILGFAATIDTAQRVRGHVDVGPTGCRVLAGKFYGPSFPFESEESHAVPAGASVEVENAFGSVRLGRGEPGQVRLKVRKVVFRQTEDEARAFADRVRASAEMVGTSLRVRTNREELERGDGSRIGFETHLELAIPPDTAVTVRNEHGAVDVSDVAAADVWGSFEDVRVTRVAGPAVVKAQHGSVLVSGVKGALSLSARHGDVTVEDVADRATLETRHGSVTARRTGTLRLEAEHGQVEVEDVRGDLEVRAQHAGVRGNGVTGKADVATSFNEVRLEKVGGEVRARAEHGSVTLTDIQGPAFAEATFNDVVLARIAGPVEVSVSHGGLRAEALDQGARVKASGNEVVIEGFRGPVEVQAERASVRLVPAAALEWPITVTTNHGEIRLQVPPGSRFELEASAQHGQLAVNVPGLTIMQSDASRLKGRLGAGGQTVKLAAENGDVRLEPRVEVAQER